MKKIFVSVFAAAVALSALTGCTRTSYAIHTNDGRTIVSDGKPKESGVLSGNPRKFRHSV
ncbi:TPA: YgdI/YgdR family lipoprotein [Enterobacter hormaechei]